ncbi:MAG: hypothetical protein QM500_12120 [Methylococcales bacterium]
MSTKIKTKDISDTGFSMFTKSESDDSTDTEHAIDQVLKKAASKPEVRDMVARLYKSFSHALLDNLDDLPTIKGIHAAEGTELIVLLAQEALKHEPYNSKRALLKLKGQIAFREQVEVAGGVFTTKEVADLLSTSPGAVRKRVERKRLLTIPFGKEARFPVWQFDEHSVVNSFANIMALLDTSSPIGIFRFFLTYDDDLKCTPIEALKENNINQLRNVKILASQFNQQIAR